MKNFVSKHAGLILNCLAALILTAGGLTWLYYAKAEADTPKRVSKPDGSVVIEKEQQPLFIVSSDEVIQLTNEYRATKGLNPLVKNDLLTQSACAKAQHMVDNDYWAHNAPDGTEPWAFIRETGYIIRLAGENLAYKYASSKGVVNGWIKSPSHEINLSGNYVDTGVCVIESVKYQGGLANVIVAHYGLQ